MWAVWWARRRAIHDNQFQSPMSTSCFISKFIEDLDVVALSKPSPPRNLNSGNRDVQVTVGNLQYNTRSARSCWLPPDVGDVKLNVDGGLSRSGIRGATAAICRDKYGTYLGASVRVFEGLTDPASLEAQACNEALSLAVDLNLSSICIASDYAEVVASLGSEAPCKYITILREIEHRSRSFHLTKFVHEKREHNSAKLLQRRNRPSQRSSTLDAVFRGRGSSSPPPTVTPASSPSSTSNPMMLRSTSLCQRGCTLVASLCFSIPLFFQFM